MNELDKLLKLVRHVLLGFIWGFFILIILSLLVVVFVFLNFR